eukprot:c53797_g1_i1.p1 GENE.c53797_g1_i1~~c53797_g1_i1.p1  ORF type:complete len:311 (-),score=71.68 c53797_g1_i1:135-1034(-)
MSDNGSEQDALAGSGDAADGKESKSQMRKRHYKELKDLQAHWKTAIKKANGKAKKDAQLTSAREEAEMNARHEAEIEGLESGDDEAPAAAAEEADPGAAAAAKKRAKAQDKKAKKAAAERAEKEAVEAEVAAMGPSKRAVEAAAIAKNLSAEGLAVLSIASDGHCLYKAALTQLGRPQDEYPALRAAVAEYIRTHRDELAPFLISDAGDMMSEEQLADYCNSIERTAAWGGQLELVAICNTQKRPAFVYSAGPVLRMGEEHAGAPMRLSYHRHELGLGEHYNAVIPAAGGPAADSDGDD